MPVRYLVLLILLSGMPAWAQDPFGQQKPEEEKPAVQAPAEFPITNPLVQTLLETRPDTPSEWILAIETLIDLKHAPLARPFVNQFLAANLNEEQLSDVHREYGSPTFLKIGAHPDLAPEGKQLADAVLDAAMKLAQDPARLANWIGQLQDPSRQVRARAIAELRRGETAAVVALLGVLADDSRTNERAAVRDALVALRVNSLKPLIAVLESDQVALKVQVIDVLRRIASPEPIEYLLGPAHSPNSPPKLKQAAERALLQLHGQVPNVQTAAGMLYTTARTEFDRSVLVRDETQPQTLWRWDAAAGVPVAQSYPRYLASLVRAVRLVRDLYAIMPQSPTVRRLYLAALLELAVHEAGWDAPLPVGEGTAHDMAAGFEPAVMEDLLASTMASGHFGAASAAAQILGETATSDILYNLAPHPSVLVQAAMHSNRRLRFEAVASIMRLAPQVPYPGSSQVLTEIIYFASSAGLRRALVLDTRLHEATRLASLLAQSGFDEADPTTHPREFLQRAATWADYELALIDYNLPNFNIDELVQMLRHDHRSREIPVLLVTSTAEDQRGARHLAERLTNLKLTVVRQPGLPAGVDPLQLEINVPTGVMVRPPDLPSMQVQIQSFLERVGPRPPAELRLQQAQQAMGWLSQLAQQDPPLYNVQRAAQVAEAALAVPALAPQAVTLVADLGAAGSQSALLGLVNRGNVPLELRQAAAQAFRHSVHRHGILLTSGEMLKQYDFYNASESEPVEVQELLGSVLDTLEGHRAAVSEPAATENTEGAAP